MDWERLLCVERRRRSTARKDHRVEFERDFDRAVFSTPVKRLQGKAQVFPLDPNDTIRTRLTHSLEVSSVARGLARGAADWLQGKGHIQDGMTRSIEAIAATCGLVHDLGNPPFGHAGAQRILNAGRTTALPGLEDDIHVSAFRTAAIGVMVGYCSEAFKKNYEEIIGGRYHGTLLTDSAASGLASTLRRIGRERVYQTPSTLKLEVMGRHVLRDLMDAFWDGAKVMPMHGAPNTRSFEGKIAALFSDNYRRVFQHFAATSARIPETYHRMQLLTDYVCGMTDAFATRLHGELFGR